MMPGTLPSKLNSLWPRFLGSVFICEKQYSQTFGTKKKWSYKTGDLLKEIFYDWTRKGWPFNTGDFLIEVTTWSGFAVCKCYWGF